MRHSCNKFLGHTPVAFSRRDALRWGGISTLGMSALSVGLGPLLSPQSVRADDLTRKTFAKSCILIWLDGGPSHLETFDPKPDAPVEVRGPMGSIATTIPGIRLNECFQQCSQMMDKLAVIRSMTSPLGEHNFGTHYLMTGYKPSPALEYPTYGATLAQLRDTATVLPPNIAVPQATKNVRGNGFLSAATAPFSVGGNPDAADFTVRDLEYYPGLDLQRLDRRREMVNALDTFSHNGDATQRPVSDPNLQRAYDLIASASAKAAFKLSEEPDAVRHRYGRGNGIGQSCLLARRLVQRGVPFVTVNSTGWDSHQNILTLKERYPKDRNAHLPSLDRALSALVTDLDDCGMLDETLVVVMGEFGRTPKINSAGGRDHWPSVFSVALAGGGIQGGQMIGTSDSMGEYPKDDPITPADLSATLFTLLGVDPASELRTSDGRPVRVSPDGGQVISKLMA
ncbi:DUF1501 domain-containing protein [Stieleria varia]|uniref:Sulfatase n=1 Tax=Stieleria varia TaxID=2528005 RepID=A0A5C6ANF0_9BACT|nr:DUF1501 domain-containing protein [Stieleria varia]TWU00941.1 hypothetical protein Pla52n_43110 [Stieleria varia]